jgi:hypothetical protein
MYHSLPVPSHARKLAPLLSVATLTGCSPTVPLPPLGSDAPHAPRQLSAPPPPPSASASEPPPPPFHLAEQLARLHRVTDRHPSDHLDGSLDGEVWVDERSRAYPKLGPNRTLGVGATLIEKHVLRETETLAVYFAMVRRPPGFDPAGDDWEYFIVSPSGEVEQRGRLAMCSRCHLDAPFGHVFGAGR